MTLPRLRDSGAPGWRWMTANYRLESVAWPVMRLWRPRRTSCDPVSWFCMKARLSGWDESRTRQRLSTSQSWEISTFSAHSSVGCTKYITSTYFLSYISLGSEFVKFVKRIRLDTVRKKLGLTHLPSVPFSPGSARGLALPPLSAMPSLITIRIQMLTNKPCRGIP